jgi:hypothetical protein
MMLMDNLNSKKGKFYPQVGPGRRTTQTPKIFTVQISNDSNDHVDRIGKESKCVSVCVRGGRTLKLYVFCFVLFFF